MIELTVAASLILRRALANQPHRIDQGSALFDDFAELRSRDSTGVVVAMGDNKQRARVMPPSSTFTSFVNGTSMRGWSAKFKTKTSSRGFDARTNASAAASTLARTERMLPLLSMIRPSEVGTSSRRNSVID